MEPGGHQERAGQGAAPVTGAAARQVRLANERTYLAWGRTALAFFALALAVGRIVPELEGAKSRWPFEVIGSAYALLGVMIALYGLHRHRVVEHSVLTGDLAEPSAVLLTVLSGLTALVGLATFVVLITS
jgi:uncharacterized membrane protein YidH (DUF202 family)